jgi:hypothetical protein
MKIDHNSFKVNTESEDSRYYVKKGDQDYIDDDNNYRAEKDGDIVCAKAVKNKLTKSVRNTNVKDYSFFIRTTPNRTVYNPFQKHTIEKNIPTNYIDHVCKKQTVFTQVSASAFNKYLDFLRNGSTKKLQDIQREIK